MGKCYYRKKKMEITLVSCECGPKQNYAVLVHHSQRDEKSVTLHRLYGRSMVNLYIHTYVSLSVCGLNIKCCTLLPHKLPSYGSILSNGGRVTQHCLF